jgi:hypothetical protein
VEPKLISQVENGRKFLIEEGDYHLHVVVVRGTSYEMGYAYGKLMATEIKDNIKNFWSYYERVGLEEVKKHVPEYLAKPILKLGRLVAHGLLSVDRLITFRRTPKRITEELRGIAKGAKMSYREVMLTNLIPEILKAWCSIVGAWGPATKTGDLL